MKQIRLTEEELQALLQLVAYRNEAERLFVQAIINKANAQLKEQDVQDE